MSVYRAQEAGGGGGGRRGGGGEVQWKSQSVFYTRLFITHTQMNV